MLIEEPEPLTQKIPWVEKYRPSCLEEVIAHEEIIKTIQKFKEEQRLPNLLLYGPPGTGKTSTIIALAKQMYGKSYQQMVLELNASDERGINTVRETIKRFCEAQSFSFSKDKIANNVKLVILDEADSMTSAAQFALRRIIEKFARNARFCFICNYVSKIIPALQSRCTRFKFKQIPFESCKMRMQQICNSENILIEQLAVEAVFKLCEGDMRRIVNMLQSLSMATSGSQDTNQVVNVDYVYTFTGMADPKHIKQILMLLLNASTIQQAQKEIKAILDTYGISIQLVLKEINNQLMLYNMPNVQKIFLVERMAEIEYRLSISCSDSVQLLALIAAFFESRQIAKN